MKTCARCHAVKDNQEYRRCGAGLRKEKKRIERLEAENERLESLLDQSP